MLKRDLVRVAMGSKKISGEDVEDGVLGRDMDDSGEGSGVDMYVGTNLAPTKSRMGDWGAEVRDCVVSSA